MQIAENKGEEKMAISRKSIAAAVSLFLMLTMAASMILLPVGGQINWEGHSKSYAYIGAVPNPAYVGEEVLLHIGITRELQITQDGWEGLTVTVTKPDGTTQTLGPFRTDSTGGTGYVFVPEKPGIYKLQTHFPAQWYNFSQFDMFSGQQQNVRIYYEADDSPVLELEVLEGTPTYWPGVPLPTEYWRRPIDSQNREWAVIAGSWLDPGGIYGQQEAKYQEDAPETAHVLWQKPLQIGGLAGGELSEPAAIFPGDAYEGKWSNTLVIMGVLIYQKFDSVGGNSVANWVVAVDIHTGETLWEKELKNPNGSRVTPLFGQVMYWKSFNTQGVHAYLWAGVSGGFFGAAPTTWEAFDPYTGRWLFTFRNVPSGNRVRGPNGEIIIYTVNLQRGFMTVWNSTAVISAYWGTTENSPMFGSWQPQGKTIDATGTVPVTSATPFGLNGYQKNITIPTGLPGSVSYVFLDDTVFGYYRGNTIGTFSTLSYNNPPFTIWAFDAKTGNLKFNKTHAAPPGNVSLSVAAASAEDRVVAIWCKELCQFWAYSLDTGEQLWGPTDPQHYLDIYAMYPTFKYGIFYSNGMSGIMYAYNATTGKLLWTYSYPDPYRETLWSNYWSSLRPRIIADGKIYLGQSEHSVNQPQPRGAPFVCLNATTGEVIWSIYGMFRQTDWGGPAVMGDSIIATMDTYNQMVYAIGKGPSKTTVEASPEIAVHGNKILVKGTVTDISPATDDIVIQKRFPNGVPAVADESMSDWMLYVYKQFPCPANVKGVEVIVEVLDPNNNYYEVARATSDGSGFYSATFEPPVPGRYTIIARFAGSKAYYGSHAETAIYVEEAPPTTATPPPAESIADIYFVPAVIGIIVVIIVATIINILVLRKRS